LLICVILGVVTLMSVQQVAITSVTVHDLATSRIPLASAHRDCSTMNVYKSSNSTVQLVRRQEQSSSLLLYTTISSYYRYFCSSFKLGFTARFLLTAAYPATNFARCKKPCACFYTRPCPIPLSSLYTSC